jgi:hypothetical protein
MPPGSINYTGGNVGIGTVSPGYTLDINSTTGINLYSTNTTTPLFKMVTFGNHNGSTFWSEDWDGTAGGPSGSMFTMDHSTGQGLYNLLAGGYNEANVFKYGSTRGACRISMGDATFGVSLSSLSSGATKGSAMTLYNSITTDTSTIILYTNAGTERMRVNVNGQVTMPAQPAFRAFYGSSGTADFTTSTILPYNATQVNIGSCYSTSTYKFTAPVAGRYIFGASTYVAGVPSMWDITTANLGVIARNEWRVTSASQTVNSIISTTTIVELSAADTVWVVWTSDTVRLIGASRFNSFWGHLIG